MTESKPLTKDEIAALHTECSIHKFDSWVWGRMAALIATIEQQAEQIERLRKALTAISDDPHCSYENSGDGQYGIGVADGHRCAANKAREALAARTKVEDAEVVSLCALLRDLAAAKNNDHSLGEDAADLLERLAGQNREWVKMSQEHAREFQRAESLSAKLAEREAELAKADAAVVALAEKRGADALAFRDCVNRDAARQQQKASAEKDKP